MQMHENPNPKMIAFHEGLLRAHCASTNLVWRAHGVT
jgi:hypothetical protein